MSAPMKISLPVRRDYAVTPVNLGVYLDRSPLAVPDGGMVDCRNVRVRNGQITNENMGWKWFGATQFPQSEPITLIDSYVSRAGISILIAGTQRFIAQWDGSQFKFLNPIRKTAVGTISMTVGDATVTGVGTTFASGGAGVAVEPGDILYITENNRRTVGITGFICGWYEVLSVTDDTHLELTENAYFTFAPGQDYTIIAGLAHSETEHWSSAMFPDAQPANEDVWYGTNGTRIVKWNGATASFTDVTTALGFSCKEIHFHKNMMLYGKLTVSGDARPNSVRNSAISEPETVTPGTLEASEFVVSEGVDDLLRLMNLGDYVVFYCERSVNIGQFVGEPLIFAVRTAIPGIGPISSKAVSDFGDYHKFLGDDRGYLFDGASVREYGGHVMREVLRRYDRTRSYYVNTLIDEENGELHWVVPLTIDAAGPHGGGPSTAFTEHYLEQVGNRPQPFTIRDLYATASGYWIDTGQKRFSDFASVGEEFNKLFFRWNDRFFSSSFPILLFGTAWGELHQLGVANELPLSLAGQSEGVNSYARMPRRPSWDGRSKGIVVRVEPLAKRYASATNYSLACSVWGADFAEGDRAKLDEQNFDLTHAGRRWVSFLEACLYHEIVFSTFAKDAPWSLSGFRVTLAQGGAG